MAKEPHTKELATIPIELIERQIYLIRGHKVMLSPDLAAIYGVETRALVQAVKRNIGRFPDDFMFQLSAEEYANLKSQIVISSWGGARRAEPYAFTELGVAMLEMPPPIKRALSFGCHASATVAEHAAWFRTRSTDPALGIAASAGGGVGEHAIAVVVAGARATARPAMEARRINDTCFTIYSNSA